MAGDRASHASGSVAGLGGFQLADLLSAAAFALVTGGVPGIKYRGGITCPTSGRSS